MFRYRRCCNYEKVKLESLIICEKILLSYTLVLYALNRMIFYFVFVKTLNFRCLGQKPWYLLLLMFGKKTTSFLMFTHLSIISKNVRSYFKNLRLKFIETHICHPSPLATFKQNRTNTFW